MAGMPKKSKLESPGAMDLTEELEGQSNLKIEEFMEVVESLQQENLDPWIEDLVNQVKEFQQLKQKVKEEMKQTCDLWETKQKELDSLNVEQLHLEEVLRKKQETLRSLLMQCKGEESEIQRQLFEEESKQVKEFLETAVKQRQQLQFKRQRIMAEIEKLDFQFISETYSISEEGATGKEEVGSPGQEDGDRNKKMEGAEVFVPEFVDSYEEGGR